MNTYFCCSLGKFHDMSNQFVCRFLFEVQLKCVLFLLAIQLYCYFTQSPSCIMTCSFALTKAWYRIAHGKVTSWLSFLGFKNNPPNIFGGFFSFFCPLKFVFLDQF